MTQPPPVESGDVMVICFRPCGSEGVVLRPYEPPPEGWTYMDSTGWHCPSCSVVWGLRAP